MHCLLVEVQAGDDLRTYPASATAMLEYAYVLSRPPLVEVGSLAVLALAGNENERSKSPSGIGESPWKYNVGVRVRPSPDRGPVADRRGVGEQHPHRDASVRCGGDTDVEGEVVVDVGVEVEEPVLHERHDPGTGHGLGDRREHEHGVRGDADLVLVIGPPSSDRPQDLFAPYDRHPEAGVIAMRICSRTKRAKWSVSALRTNENGAIAPTLATTAL
jgi:hypothetical protein